MSKPIIHSGCVGVCTIASGTCKGCGRTMAEIRNWLTMNESQRIATHERIANDPHVNHMLSQSSKRILENYSGGIEED